MLYDSYPRVEVNCTRRRALPGIEYEKMIHHQPVQRTILVEISVTLLTEEKTICISEESYLVIRFKKSETSSKSSVEIVTAVRRAFDIVK